jgi:hypothetical protein
MDQRRAIRHIRRSDRYGGNERKNGSQTEHGQTSNFIEMNVSRFSKKENYPQRT